LQILENVIREMGGTIHIAKNNYVAATFRSRIFRFVDDFEIRIDPVQKVIHVRSASRVGKGDMGVNKKRVELFRRLLNQKISESNIPLNATPNTVR